MEEREPSVYGHCDALFNFVVGIAVLIAVIGALLLVLALASAIHPEETANSFSPFAVAVLGLFFLAYALATYILIIPGKIFLDMARNIRHTALDTAEIRRQIAEQNPHEEARREEERKQAAAVAQQQQKAAQLKADREEAERLLKERLAQDKAKQEAEQEERERLRRQHIDRTKVEARAALDKIARKAERAYQKYHDQPDRLDDLVTAILSEVDQLLETTQDLDDAHQTTLTREIERAFNAKPIFQTLQVELKSH